MTQQSPRETWTGWNHRFQEGVNSDGYAFCTLCGTREDEDEIIKPCPKGPVVATFDNATKEEGR